MCDMPHARVAARTLAPLCTSLPTWSRMYRRRSAACAWPGVRASFHIIGALQYAFEAELTRIAIELKVTREGKSYASYTRYAYSTPAAGAAIFTTLFLM
jgi:hypothetical protein